MTEPYHPSELVKKMQHRSSTAFASHEFNEPAVATGFLQKPVIALKLRSIGTANSFMSCFCCSDKPLALYIFSNDKSKIEKIMNSTSSGGFLANDTVVHVGGK